MITTARPLIGLTFTCCAGLLSAAAVAQTTPAPGASPAPAASASPATSASPAASATPSGPSDPCGSILSIASRPTVTTGVCTVQTGHFDVEAGYTNTVTTGAGGGNTAVYPQPLIKVGTFDRHLDFEFSPPTRNQSSVGGAVTSGWGDIALGAKYELGYTSKAVWGINGVVTLPTGTKGFSAGNAQYTGNINAGYTFNSEFGIAGTLSFNALSGFNSGGIAQSFFAFIPSVVVTAALPGGPSQLFAEYAHFSQAGVGLGGKDLFDFGYQRDFGPHLQFDVEYGFSPTLLNGQKQHYVGGGLSFMN